MYEQEEMFCQQDMGVTMEVVRDEAFARTDDPETSHEAAESLSPETLRLSQAAVYAVFLDYSPLTDTQLIDLYEWMRLTMGLPKQSPSGLRTRRNELRDGRLVRDSGEKAVLDSGRRSILWELCEQDS